MENTVQLMQKPIERFPFTIQLSIDWGNCTSSLSFQTRSRLETETLLGAVIEGLANPHKVGFTVTVHDMTFTQPPVDAHTALRKVNLLRYGPNWSQAQ